MRIMAGACTLTEYPQVTTTTDAKRCSSQSLPVVLYSNHQCCCCMQNATSAALARAGRPQAVGCHLRRPTLQAVRQQPQCSSWAFSQEPQHVQPAHHPHMSNRGAWSDCGHKFKVSRATFCCLLADALKERPDHGRDTGNQPAVMQLSSQGMQ